jgi:LAS superfamily LD-carboxypeptidase LdcB
MKVYRIDTIGVIVISLQEILKTVKLEDQPEDVQENLAVLLEKINKVRSKYAKPMKVTSGFRSMQDHLRIYKEKAGKEGKPFDQTKVPMKSKHLSGQAVDIYDPAKDLQKWCKENESFLESVGIWMEDFSATPNWVHFQTVPPKSGKRWFLP